MQTPSTPPWLRYGAVIPVLAAVLLFRWLFLGSELPFLLLWPAIMFVAWYGGLGPGLLTTFLAALTTAYLAVMPPHWFTFSKPADWLGLALFVLLGSAISFLTEWLHRARRQVEAHAGELFRQREQFRVTLTGIGDGVIATDAEERVTFLNDMAQLLTGWKADEAVGQPLERVFVIVHEQTRRPVENPVRMALRTGRIAALANQTVLVARSGTAIPIDDSAAPLRDEHGEIRGAVLAFHDVTERRQLEQELRLRAEKLALADRRKDEFLAVLGHELRNPLAPIRTAVQLLGLPEAPEPDRQWARQVIARQVGQLTRLVDDLLDVSRISQGKVQLRRGPVELAEVVGRAVETSRPLLEARKHRLTKLLPAEPVWVEADQARLTQVIANLLNNAAKYTAEGGHVWLTAERRGAEAVIRVRDDGIGMAPEVLPHVFDLFAQADEAVDRAEGGLGIGLTLVKRLVELHGGTVEANSAGPGSGSEFVVRLPAGQPPPPTPAETAPGQAAAPPGRRILVVDDNQDTAQTLALLLQLQGHETRAAYDGAAALETARGFRPDVVLLDLGLPRMDGYEVARRLRSQPGAAPLFLVALTGWGQAEDRRRTREAGFDCHLVKPVDAAELQNLLAARPETGRQDGNGIPVRAAGVGQPRGTP